MSAARHRCGAGHREFPLDFDFAGEQDRLSSLSADIVRDTTGTTWMDYSRLVLDAEGLSVAVFTIFASDASRNMRIENLGESASVIINILGDTIDFGSADDDEFTAGQVLFNLPQAIKVTLHTRLEGSLLAPLASMQATGGRIVGQAIVESWTGSGTRIEADAFRGVLPPALPVPLPVAEVSTPGSTALLVAGMLVAAGVTRRRRG